MEKLLSKFKDLSNKKQIENVVIFLVLLIIVIIVINSLFGEEKETVKEGPKEVSISLEQNENDLEKSLKNILSKISGVGSVDVMVSYSNTIMQVPMYDTKENTTVVEESDKNGGIRKTKEVANEQSIIYEEKNSVKVPAIKQTIMPEVVGVIVVAEGAGSQVVKENIKNAVGEDASDYEFFNSIPAKLKDIRKLRKILERLETYIDYYTWTRFLEIQTELDKINDTVASKTIDFKKVDTPKDEPKAD